MVKVWSLWIRLFHWLLVFGLTLQYFNDGGGEWHEWIGYATAALILLRVIYGLKTSNPYEKWSHFRVSPREFADSFVKMLRGRLARSFKHPPQAAFVMLLIFLVTLLAVLTGHMLEMYFFFGEDWLQLLHEYLSYGILALAAFHILGVLHASRLWRENLTLSMFHGRRRRLKEPENS